MDVMYDIAIGLIKEYIERNLSLNGFLHFVGWFWKDEPRLQHRLYSRWAAKEILTRVMDNCFALPDSMVFHNVLDDIDDFIMHMCYLQTIRSDYGFRIAIETAEGIKDYLKTKIN